MALISRINRDSVGKNRWIGRIELIILYTLLIIFAAWFVVPFFWLLSSSLKEPHELFSVPIQWLPSQIQFENFIRMFNALPFMLYLRNTLIIVFFTIVGRVASSCFVAYGFSRISWPGRDKVFIVVLATMILPFQVVMVPLFLQFQRFGWIGTFLPLTLTQFFGHPFSIFLLRQFFMAMPMELSEAAKIDGASEFRVFWQICVPLARPAIATVAIFAFLAAWNDFIGPLIFLTDSRLYTLSIGAHMIRSDIQPNWELLLALGVVMVTPVLIIFFLLQKYFIQGIALSGIKG